MRYGSHESGDMTKVTWIASPIASVQLFPLYHASGVLQTSKRENATQQGSPDQNTHGDDLNGVVF